MKYINLGSEKYTSVLNSIYAGLGVPPTLTGMATNGGGFTNNFISLKTLVERHNMVEINRSSGKRIGDRQEGYGL